MPAWEQWLSISSKAEQASRAARHLKSFGELLKPLASNSSTKMAAVRVCDFVSRGRHGSPSESCSENGGRLPGFDRTNAFFAQDRKSAPADCEPRIRIRGNRDHPAWDFEIGLKQTRPRLHPKTSGARELGLEHRASRVDRSKHWTNTIGQSRIRRDKKRAKIYRIVR
jgi:hypothetical protein